MKKLIVSTIAAAVVLILSSSNAAAQAGSTASGTLTVTATVTASINLIFQTDAAGVALGGSGTNAATLAFGNINAFGALSAGVARTSVTAANFTVQSAVDVKVSQANSNSTTFTLKAQLGAADATNTWSVGGVAVTSAAASTVTSTGAYGAATNFPVALTVPFATASGTTISNTINYTATSN